MQPRDRHVAEIDHLDVAAQDVRARRVEPPFVAVARLRQAERKRIRVAHRAAPRIVAVHHAALRVHEDSLLRPRVVRHGVVAIHVVLREVQHRRRLELEARGGLELVAGQFDHVEVRVAALPQRIEHRHADVARDDRVEPSRAAHLAGERGHGRLPVGAGDADHPRLSAANFTRDNLVDSLRRRPGWREYRHESTRYDESDDAS